nr:uncharacterized protein LOC109175482 [Ipomoea batatas]
MTEDGRNPAMKEDQETMPPLMTKQTPKGPDLSEKYGSWMIATRKARRGPMNPNTQGLENSPRRNNGGNGPRGKNVTPRMHQTTFPRGRSGHGPNRDNPRNQVPPQLQASHHQVSHRSPTLRGGSATQRRQGGRGGISNRAAVESNNVVVRGSENGKKITTTVVQTMEGTSEAPLEVGLEAIFQNEPPDIPAIFNSTVNPVAEDMDLGNRDKSSRVQEDIDPMRT